MPFLLTPDEDKALFAALTPYIAARDAYSAGATPLVVAGAGAVYRQAPTAPPGAIVAAAQQIGQAQDPRAATQQAAAAAQAAAKLQHFSLTVPVKKVGGPSLNPLDAVKTGVRTGLAAAQGGLEMVQNRAAQAVHTAGDIVGDVRSGDISGAVQSYAKGLQMANPFSVAGSLGQSGAQARQEAFGALGATTPAKVVQNVAAGNGPGLGQGFLPEGFSTQEQSAAARQVRGTIAGHAWTVGRQVASLVVEPGTKPYNLLSGLVDAGVAMKADPAAAFAAHASEARAAAKVFRGVTETELADESAKAAAGLISAERYAVDPMRADQFIKGATGQRVVQSLADDNQFLSVWQKLGGRVDPALAVKIAAEKDPEKVAEILRGELGVGPLRSTSDLPAASRLYEVQRTVRRVVPGLDDLGPKGTFAMKPGRYVTTASDATLAEKIDTINNTDNLMRMVKVDAPIRSKAIGKLAASMGQSGFEQFDATKNYLKILEGAFTEAGMDKDMAQALTRIRDHEGIALFGQRHLAIGSDVDHLAKILGDPDVSMTGPGLLSEGFGGRFVLPDPRQINRLTSRWGAIVASGADRANLRLPFVMAEFMQNQLWKGLTVLRPATALRILGEEQVRMAANDFPSFFHHPLDYILQVTHRKQDLSALGMSFDQEAAVLNNEGADMRKALRQNIFRTPEDAADGARHAYKTGDWVEVDRADRAPEWRRGAVHQIGMLQADPYAAAYARGETIDSLMARSGFDPAGNFDPTKIDDELHAAFMDRLGRGDVGEPYATATTKGAVGVDYTMASNFRSYLEGNIAPRVDSFAAGDQRVLDAIGHNMVGATEHLDNSALTFVKRGPDPAAPWMGATVRDAEGNVGKIAADHADGTSSVNFNKPALSEGALFRDPSGTPLGGLLEDHRLNPDAPQRLKYPVLAYDRSHRWSIEKSLDQATRPFFTWLMEKPSNYLSRSPFFRRAYYQRMAEMADRLTPEAANQLLKNIDADSRAYGFLGKVEEFLGGDKTTNQIVERAGRASGTLSLEDLDMYAKGHALDHTQNLLYDASRKRNAEDALRIVVPFGQAYKEILTSWGKLLARNPAGILRRGQQVIEGARGAGFFYNDPQTGQEIGNYPLSNLASRFLTSSNPVTKTFSKVPGLNALVSASGPGLDNLFTGNVQGLNIAGNFLPTAGPMAQIALSAIIPAKPAYDQVRALLLPYGESPSLQSTLVPDWMEKVISGIRDDPSSNNMFGRMYTDTFQALAASGQYNPNDPTSVAKMKSDAEDKARVLMILRGFGQFTLPASPQPEEKIQTNQGDMLASELSKDFVRLEQEDYTTAVGKFLDLYGEQPFLYAVGKTKAVNGGLSPSKVFGDWEREHGAFLKSYSKVAGFFGPAGDDFSMDVYQRQLDSKERVRLTDQQMLDKAQATIARWKYNQARDKLGQTPSKAQRNWLATYKDALQQDYPAYATESDYNPNELPTAIAQLKQAATDPRVSDTPVAAAVNEYMKLRDAALGEAQRRTGLKTTTLAGKKQADLREWLDGAAVEVSRSYPEFQRVWDRLLSKEVDANA